MNITNLGLFFLPVGLMLFALAPSSLYKVAIFFSPFGVASLLNSASGYPLVLGKYFGCLFILGELLHINFSARVSRFTLLIISFLVAFLGIAWISILWPMFVDGGLRTFIGDAGNSSTISYTIHSIDSLYPISFGIIFCIFLIVSLNNKDKLVTAIRVYVAAALFVAFWGYLQFFCNLLHLKYPAFLFNNALVPSMQGYKEVVNVDGVIIHRISSVMHEPSMLAKFLLTVIPILLASVLLNGRVFGKLMDWLILAFIFVLLLLTTSTSAYVGGLIAYVSTIAVLVFCRGLRWKIAASSFGALVCLYLLFFLLDPYGNDVFNRLILHKLSSGSGIQRLHSVISSWHIFLQVPLLGAGWGTVTSHDLFVKLLSNVGLIGCLTFLALIFVALRRTTIVIHRLSQRSSKEKDLLWILSGTTSAFATLFLISTITGAELYLEYFYISFSFVVSASCLGWRKLSDLERPRIGSFAERSVNSQSGRTWNRG